MRSSLPVFLLLLLSAVPAASGLGEAFKAHLQAALGKVLDTDSAVEEKKAEEFAKYMEHQLAMDVERVKMTENAEQFADPAKQLKAILRKEYDLDDVIEIGDSSGGTKKVKVKDVLDRMDKQEEMIEKVRQGDDGMLRSEDKGEIRMDDLMKDPEHSRLKEFILLGRFSQAVLMGMGYAEGNITNVESSPRFVPEEPTSRGMQGSDLPTLFVLTVNEGQENANARN